MEYRSPSQANQRTGDELVKTLQAMQRTLDRLSERMPEIELTEGLQEGEEIVTGSYKTLRTLKVDARLKVDKDKKS